MEKRLKEIFERKQEIRSMLENQQEKVDLDALKGELDKLNAEEKELRARQEMAAALAAAQPEAGGTIDKPDKAEERDKTDLYDTLEYRKAFMKFVTRGEKLPAEFRADASTTTSDLGAPGAGAAIPTTTLNRIVDKMEATGMILPRVTRTAYKGGLSIPTSTVKPTASWVAEGATSDLQKKTTGKVTFAYYKLRCAVSVSLETDVMALSAFEAALVNNITEAMTKAIEQAIVSGDGNDKPTGIITTEAPDGQTIEVSEFNYKTLQSIEDAIPVAYENGGVYVMSKKTFGQFAGMLDANKQPIARVTYGINNATERALLGRPVVCCDYLPSYDAAEAGAVFAFVFRMEDYVLNTNYNMTMKQYEDDKTDDIVRKAIMLVDGKVVDNGSLVLLKKPASK